MAERMVQVPVSQEQLDSVVAEWVANRNGNQIDLSNVADLKARLHALLSQPTPSAEPDRTFDDGYDGGHADGWAAALDVARGVAEDEGIMNYEETNRAAGAVAVVAALERGGEPIRPTPTPPKEQP